MATHSCVIAPQLKDSLSMARAGKYGRMLPDLPSPQIDDALLIRLARSHSQMDAADSAVELSESSDNPRIPAGFPIFGQFIAHDITADRSLLIHHARLNELRNFRSPRLDLECLYGAGPTGNPYLYDLDDPDKFLLGLNERNELLDLPRNRQGRALVGDPRNDVHLIISQLHLAFLKFHNAVVDILRARGVPADAVFAQAQQLVRWHYQWIMVHEYLTLSVGEGLVQDILQNGARYYTFTDEPFIPVEFADAAYRFGHSQIRSDYILNDSGAHGAVFPDCAGTCAVSHDRAIQWKYFFQTDSQHPPQASKRIDTLLSHSLIDLPESVVGVTETPEQHSLAYRDLVRGQALELPAGEAVARAFGVRVLEPDEVGLNAIGWQAETPLWYYILRESEVVYNGEQLGPVGGRIVAEVLIGLLEADPGSYRNAGEGWQPDLPASQAGKFTMADLLRYAQ